MPNCIFGFGMAMQELGNENEFLLFEFKMLLQCKDDISLNSGSYFTRKRRYSIATLC
jgi:hypothetical protein